VLLLLVPCLALLLLIQVLTSPSLVLLLLTLCFALLLLIPCFVLLLLLVGVLYSPLFYHVQVGAWSTRLKKEKKGRFFKTFFYSIVLLFCFDVFGFV